MRANAHAAVLRISGQEQMDEKGRKLPLMGPLMGPLMCH